MKYLIFVIFLFLKITTSAYASNVVYIDMSYILSNSIKGKSILEELESKNKNNIKELESKEKILKDLEKNISNQKNILSKEEFEKKVNELQGKVIIFRKEIVATIKRVIEWFKINIPDGIKNFFGMKDKEIKFSIDENKLIKVENVNSAQNINANLNGSIEISSTPGIVAKANSKMSGMKGNLGLNMNNLTGAAF